MKNTKKLAVLSMSFIMACDTVVFAQVTPPVTSQPNIAVVAGAGGGTTSQLYPGEYGSTNYSQVMDSLIKKRADLQKEDREYLKSIGERISARIRNLIRLQKSLANLSQQSQTDARAVRLVDVLNQVNETNSEIAQIKLEIQQSSIIDSKTLPGYVAAVGDKKLDMGPGSLIDLNGALNGFTSQATQLVDEINKLIFANVTHKGITAKIKGTILSPDLSEFPSMSEGEIKQAIAEADALSVISAETRKKQQILNDLTVFGVKRFISLVGTEKFLNIRNENDRTAALELSRNIEKYFFMRSYLRKKYGLQIGAVQPSAYPANNSLNFKDWLSPQAVIPVRTALNSIISQSAQTDSDLWKAFESARQFVELYDRLDSASFLSTDAKAKRAAAVSEMNKKNAGALGKLKAGYDYITSSFASKKEIQAQKQIILNEDQRNVAYNSDDTGVMARLSNLFITATGQKSTVEALLIVMRLVLADIREEVMLSQGDMAALQVYYQKRYMSTNTQKIKTMKSMCEIDNKLSEVTRSSLAGIMKGYLAANVNDKNYAVSLGINEKFTCGGRTATAGILGNVRQGAGNALTQINSIMDSYELYEVGRAQKARNLRQLAEASLKAQSRSGDQVNQNHLTEGF